MVPRRQSATAVQRVVHRDENLIDGDRIVLITVARAALGDLRLAQRYVHHQHHVADRDRAVAAAVAATRFGC